MLSSQTKDPVTHEAMMNLRRNLPGGLTLESLRSSTDKQIQDCICKVVCGFPILSILPKAADVQNCRVFGDGKQNT